jgi:hypothetical protein
VLLNWEANRKRRSSEQDPRSCEQTTKSILAAIVVVVVIVRNWDRRKLNWVLAYLHKGSSQRLELQWKCRKLGFSLLCISFSFVGRMPSDLKSLRHSTKRSVPRLKQSCFGNLQIITTCTQFSCGQ